MNLLGAELHRQRLKRTRPTWKTHQLPNNTSIQVSSLPGLHVGSITWEGSEILLRHLLQIYKSTATTLNFLELGSGTGFVGLALLACLPLCTVTLTEKDNPPELQLLSENLAKNTGILQRGTVAPLSWGEEEHDVNTTATPYDVIVASDVLYSSACVEPLFKTISQLLVGASTSMYLCYKQRDADAEQLFFDKLDAACLQYKSIHQEGAHTIYHITCNINISCLSTETDSGKKHTVCGSLEKAANRPHND